MMDEMWIFDDVWMCHEKNSSEVSFTELQSLQALRHLESLALQSFELRCVAAPLRCAESLALLEGQRSLGSSGTRDFGRRVFARLLAPLSNQTCFSFCAQGHICGCCNFGS